MTHPKHEKPLNVATWHEYTKTWEHDRIAADLTRTE